MVYFMKAILVTFRFTEIACILSAARFYRKKECLAGISKRIFK